MVVDRVAPESEENSTSFPPLTILESYNERNIVMRTLFISFVFVCVTLAQTDVIITSTIYSAISGRSEFHRMKDRALFAEGDKEYLNHSKIWHTLEIPEALSAFSVGGVIALDSFKDKFKPEIMISDLILAGAIRWMVYDGVYNISQGNNWFHQSGETMSFLEPLGSPYFKIIILTTAIIIRLMVE